ncbi:MAG: hypothetical protein LBB84_03705 [Tannerellaceae bacterium]|nr:hypothetical protein [Tannerellaceae bacterium]
MEEKEIVYYQMFSKETQNYYEKVYPGILKDDQKNPYLIATNIEANNKAFLRQLDEDITNGCKYVYKWLDGLTRSYASRYLSVHSSLYPVGCYESWLNNTKLIIGDKHAYISMNGAISTKITYIIYYE